MKNHLIAHVHGAKQVGRFFQSISGYFPKKTGILRGFLLRKEQSRAGSDQDGK
jgi:hypothetical protein